MLVAKADEDDVDDGTASLSPVGLTPTVDLEVLESVLVVVLLEAYVVCPFTTCAVQAELVQQTGFERDGTL